MIDESTFHRAEQAIQKRLGVFDEISPWASKVVRPCLPEQHRDFYRQLPFLVAAARDARGRPWATLLSGESGFTHSPNPTRLSIDAQPSAGDALEGALVAGRPVGLLGIELATRRRNRVNGRIDRSSRTGIEIEVAQSFGNCPQYIREREWERNDSPSRPETGRRSKILDSALRTRIEAADTFFIASGYEGEANAPSHGMDASHRGGPSGFVRVVNERAVVFPDYAGNNHFNTIGNLAVDARAGLLFVDFETGGLLQLTGHTQIDWDSPAVADYPGAQRLIHFELDEAIDRPGAAPLRWKPAEDALLNLKVVDKVRESEDVMSFILSADDGGALPDFRPGQHLPIRLEIPGLPERLTRTYSLSNGPGEGVYRISVKREARGTVSRFLHDSIGIGGRLQAQPPAGDFVLEAGDRPVVLVSAGIGSTPMLSMLRALARSRPRRPVEFLHVARDGGHHAFKQETRDLVDAMPGAARHVFYSQPLRGDLRGRDFDAQGRLDVSALRERLGDLDADYYLCGPVAFMASVASGLEAQGVSPGRIHSESFGPATIR